MSATTSTTPSYAGEFDGLRDNLRGMLPADALASFDAAATAQGKTHTAGPKLSVGDTAPGFTLPDAEGNPVALRDLLKQGKVILTFYRGAWCPYCNLQLNGYQRALPEFTARGAQLVAISPQNAGSSAYIASENKITFPVLSDVGSNVAEQYTIVFKNDEGSVKAMADLGYDYDSFYDDDSRKLPVPAVFVIEQDGTVSFAKIQGGDYRERVEASDILAAL